MQQCLILQFTPKLILILVWNVIYASLLVLGQLRYELVSSNLLSLRGLEHALRERVKRIHSLQRAPLWNNPLSANQVLP
jgi:hypothetical protein